MFEHESRVVYECPVGMKFRGATAETANERLDTITYNCGVTGWDRATALNECVCESK